MARRDLVELLGTVTSLGLIDVNAFELNSRGQGTRHQVGTFENTDTFAPAKRAFLNETPQSTHPLV